MKFFNIFIVIILFTNCSFDKRTGIWKNEDNLTKKEDVTFKDFKTISSANEFYEKSIPIDKNFKFKLKDPLKNTEWSDIFFSDSNNYTNFKYDNKNKTIYQSQKLTKNNINESILFKDEHIIFSDKRGNIIVFSINQNKIITKFNFYKKKLKKIDKIINLIIDNNIIFASDNLGYLYAFDYKKNTILWAKNYKIPFRSNLKLINTKLISADQNNNLYFFEKKNGNTVKLIPTEETLVKNQFINNISLTKNSIFFLNTYGSLYSIDKNTLSVKWFLNLNQSLDLNPSNLFSGTELVNNNNKIIVTTNYTTYIINTNSGSILYKNNISSNFKPIIYNNYLFLISKKNYLVCINLNSGKIIYSSNINKKISEFLKEKRKEIDIHEIMILNNEIYIFLKNSQILVFDIAGEVKSIRKLNAKMNSNIIIIDGSILFVDSKKKLFISD
ncbi:PQQ-binding-like beta-propeller repeat protein [Pelagibacterales bacterium SAG-MED41]|nr:PQQ-binding-like beta-propeller repeat protein [Pelagibacterales bacterium SAG-MED41]|tara:strand:+ start:1608 stop:2933 length:1326 start_codon:yes stop_codon:yes gene_type:complete